MSIEGVFPCLRKILKRSDWPKVGGQIGVLLAVRPVEGGGQTDQSAIMHNDVQ